MLYIIITILIFGVLIATHELGHFAAAKALRVRVNEFSVGMGPAVWQSRRPAEEDSPWEKGEEKTLYSLRLLPIGGYCAMEGEDGDSADPHAFGRAAGWKKLVILCAGAAMNFLTGLLILLALNSRGDVFVLPAVSGFMEGYGLEECGLEPGDLVLSVNGRRMYSLYGQDRLLSILSQSGDSADWVVERGGEKITLKNVSMPVQERRDEAGNVTRYRGLSIGLGAQEATPGRRLLYSWYASLDLVHMVWSGLASLVTGQVGLREMSGPVGVVDIMSEVGAQAPDAATAVETMALLSALLAVNLAVMNLLPLPALDGGRVFFLILNGLLYTLFRRKIDPRYEGYVHLAGMAALMVLMLAVTLSDVGKLFGK